VTDRPQPDSSATTGLTVAAVAGVVVCCAAPLLVAAGVLTSAGVLLNNVVFIALAAGVLGWALTRAIRTLRARDRSAERHDHSGT
jgi:Flp pilus assembly protein TadB